MLLWLSVRCKAGALARDGNTWASCMPPPANFQECPQAYKMQKLTRWPQLI
jgi:hypothetical protein